MLQENLKFAQVEINTNTILHNILNKGNRTLSKIKNNNKNKSSSEVKTVRA